MASICANLCTLAPRASACASTSSSSKGYGLSGRASLRRYVLVPLSTGSLVCPGFTGPTFVRTRYKFSAKLVDFRIP
eukprot:1614922-Pyramimonas_sp.AAC.1